MTVLGREATVVRWLLTGQERNFNHVAERSVDCAIDQQLSIIRSES
jgi:hypothetical protein